MFLVFNEHLCKQLTRPCFCSEVPSESWCQITYFWCFNTRSPWSDLLQKMAAKSTPQSAEMCSHSKGFSLWKKIIPRLNETIIQKIRLHGLSQVLHLARFKKPTAFVTENMQTTEGMLHSLHLKSHSKQVTTPLSLSLPPAQQQPIPQLPSTAPLPACCP